jgi:hypothetical protein
MTTPEDFLFRLRAAITRRNELSRAEPHPIREKSTTAYTITAPPGREWTDADYDAIAAEIYAQRGVVDLRSADVIYCYTIDSARGPSD